MITLVTPASSKPVTVEDLARAIELACSPVLGALNMANAIGGLQTDAWRLVREFSLVQLIDEAISRDVDLASIKAACCDVPVVDTPPFRAAVGYDPRPRCTLCNRPHFIRVGGETERSCGRNQKTFYPPETRWSRSTAEAAVEGRYEAPNKDVPR